MKIRHFILFVAALLIAIRGALFQVYPPLEIATNWDALGFICWLLCLVAIILTIGFGVMGLIVLLVDKNVLPEDHWLNKKLW